MSRASATLRRRLLGVAMLGVIVLFFGGSVATYLGAFKPVTNVLLRADRTGNQLQPESDVKVRGLTVGEVRDISSRGDGASLRLELHRDKVGMIPANVSARLIPKTLFGEEVRGRARPPLLPLPHAPQNPPDGPLRDGSRPSPDPLGGNQPSWPNPLAPSSARSWGSGAASTAPASASNRSDLGLSNSPGERELVATMMAASLGAAPKEMPSWSSMLVGPVFRGADVTLR